MRTSSNKAVAFSLIFISVLVSYFNTLGSGFVYDDADVIINNPFIKDWSQLHSALTSGFLANTSSKWGFFRPLTTLSYLLEYSIGGASPFIYHLDNVILHFLVSTIVYLLLDSMLRDGKAALAGALVFAVHPVHTEAVAWVSCRGDLLAALFIFLAVWLFIARPAGKASGALSLAAFFLGLLSKENAAIVLALLAVYVLLYWDGRAGRGRVRMLLQKTWPYFAVIFVYLAIRLAVAGDSLPRSAAARPAFLLMCEALTHYIRLSFLPFNLSAIYDFPPPSFPSFTVIFPIALVFAAVLFSGKIIRASRDGYFAAAWFFVALAPVSNMVPIDMLMAERALYVPTFAVSLLLGLACRRLSGVPVKGAVVALLALFVVLTASRNQSWKDDLAFWTENVRKNPYSDHVRNGLGCALMKQGRTDEAIGQFEAAVGLNYRNPKNHELLSGAYSEKGEPARAVEEGRLAVELGGSASAHVKLGVAYWKAGLLDDAFEEFSTALRLNPYVQDAHGGLGVVYGTKGMTDKAIEEFEKALRLNPDDGTARKNLDAALRIKEEETNSKGR